MFVDVIALVLGVFFTIRKLDLRRREAEDFPGIERAAFEHWKQIEVFAYTVGSTACFAKVVLDYTFLFAASRLGFGSAIVRGVGFSLFLAWVGAVAFCVVRAGTGRRLRTELGIDLSRQPPQPG